MICTDLGCTIHYGCILRNKGIRLGPSASATARVNMRPSRMAEPSWEKGILTERRPGGYEVPVLNADLSGPVSIKEYSENRHRIDDMRRREIQNGVGA